MIESPSSDQARDGSVPQKRPRPVLSCQECRRKKLKCDRSFPCQQCQKSHLLCAYSDSLNTPSRADNEDGRNYDHVPPTKKARLRFEGARDVSQVGPSESAAPAGIGIIEDLQRRVSRLESALSLETLERASPTKGGREHHVSSGHTVGLVEPTERRLYLARSSFAGTRWTAYHFEEATAFMAAIQKPNTDPVITSIGNELHSLHVTLRPLNPRLQRQPNISIQDQMLSLIPQREICDELIDVYFENYEHCLRIIHRPSFLAEYWTFRDSREPDGVTGNGKVIQSKNFVPRLLVLLLVAVSSEIRPVCKNSSLYYESGQFPMIELIQEWLERLKPKERNSLHILQIRALIVLLKKCSSSRKDSSWNYSASVVRYAMSADLHREPNYSMPVIEAEQRRRLWASILELDLETSICCGMPSMLTSEDYTCRLPANINDDDLHTDLSDLPHSRTNEQWTDSICQSTLAESLGARLDAYRLITQKTGDLLYDDVLAYTRQVERLLQNLAPPLRFGSASDGHIRNPAARFNAQVAFDVILRRSLISLYTPFAQSMPADDCFREARMGHVQSCLVLLCYQDLFDPKFSELDASQSQVYWDLFYRYYEDEVMQTTLGTCLEIKRIVSMQGSPGTSNTASTIDDTSPLAKIPQWSEVSMIKGFEDTLEPMTRRIGRSGCNLKDLACLSIVFHSVRTKGTQEMKRMLIQEGLRELILDCRRQMERNGVAVRGAAPAIEDDGSVSFIPTIDSQSNTPDFALLFDDILGEDLDLLTETKKTEMNKDPGWQSLTY